MDLNTTAENSTSTSTTTVAATTTKKKKKKEEEMSTPKKVAFLGIAGLTTLGGVLLLGALGFFGYQYASPDAEVEELLSINEVEEYK